MKQRTIMLILGDPSEKQISISIQNDSCAISISEFKDGKHEAAIVSLTPEEAEEIGSFINKEIFTQSLEG